MHALSGALSEALGMVIIAPPCRPWRYRKRISSSASPIALGVKRWSRILPAQAGCLTRAGEGILTGFPD